MSDHEFVNEQQHDPPGGLFLHQFACKRRSAQHHHGLVRANMLVNDVHHELQRLEVNALSATRAREPDASTTETTGRSLTKER